MSAHPPDLCPLCQQRALALNTAGTLLACTACGAQAEFDGTTRRVRYTRVPQAFARFDGPLRGRWLTRSAVFDIAAISSLPRIKPLWLWVAALVLLVGVGAIGLVVALTNKLPAQRQARVGNISTAEVSRAGLSISPVKPTLINTAVVIVTATPLPHWVTVLPTTVPLTPQPTQAATAAPTLVATAVAPISTTTTVVLPASTAQPQSTSQIAVPTVDAQRSAPVVSIRPTSSPTTCCQFCTNSYCNCHPICFAAEHTSGEHTRGGPNAIGDCVRKAHFGRYADHSARANTHRHCTYGDICTNRDTHPHAQPDTCACNAEHQQYCLCGRQRIRGIPGADEFQ